MATLVFFQAFLEDMAEKVHNLGSDTLTVICYYDYGSAVTMASSETFDIDFGASLFSMS